MPFVTHAGSTFLFPLPNVPYLNLVKILYKNFLLEYTPPLNNVQNVLNGCGVESNFRDEVSTSDYSMVDDDNDDDGVYIAESDADQLNRDDSTKLVANRLVCTLSTINSPACSEIQLIDELLIYEDEEILSEIDELYDELLDLSIS